MTARGRGQRSAGDRRATTRARPKPARERTATRTRTTSDGGRSTSRTRTTSAGSTSRSSRPATKANRTSATRGRSGRPGSDRATAGGDRPTRPKKATAGGRPRAATTQKRGTTSRSARARATASRRPTRPARPARPARKPQPRKRGPARVRLASGPLRIRFILVLVAVIISLFAGRLVQLQGLDASTYAAAARSIGVTNETLVAPRGDIVDRNGRPLATTAEAYDLWVDQQAVDNPAAYALRLGEVLDADLATLQRTLTGDRRFRYVAKGISGADWRRIEALGLPGIGADPVSQRSYPLDAVAGNIVGFIGSDGHGMAGLEQSFEATLAGANGSATYQLGPGGQRIPSGAVNAVEQPEKGVGLALTLDRDLQWYTEEALADAVAGAKADDGVAIVMDTETFEIVAMASTPLLDPARPAGVDAAARGNKAVEWAYEPGSVFKPLTMAALIDSGVAGPASVYSVPDAIERSGTVIHDHYNHPEQQMTLAGALAKSSNVGTLLATEDLDSNAYYEYLSAFGIGQPVHLGLPAETRGSLTQDMSDLTRDNVSFGQGVAVNVVQMAAAYATIANGGVRLDPTLVAAELDDEGDPLPTKPRQGTRVVSEDAARSVTDMMQTVMGPEGTGEPAAVEGYHVAGKPGTAQRVDPSCGCYRGYDSSFMGFAPADDPRYVVAVSLFNTRNGNSGGRLAGPAFADIMGFALERAGVAPSDTEPDYLPVFPE